jgi:hypothetical protein
MNDRDQDLPPLLGTEVGPEELFYIEWARETKKKNIAVATDALQRLVTLNCALLGGSIALYRQSILPFWIQPVVIVFFFLSLLCSVYGMIPQVREADANDPEDIRDKKDKILEGKVRVLWAASFFLIVGFALCLLAMPFGFFFPAVASKP